MQQLLTTRMIDSHRELYITNVTPPRAARLATQSMKGNRRLWNLQGGTSGTSQR